MTFVGRQVELTAIERFLRSRRAELVIVYGRRGVGKSTLLREALSGRRHWYFQAT